MRRVLGLLAVVAVALLGFAGPAQADYYGAYRNAWTSRCIDDSETAGLRSNTCNFGDWQMWWAEERTDERFILSVDSTFRCIEDSFGGGLRSASCDIDGPAWQQWRIVPRGGGLYELSNWHTNRCLDDSWEFGLRAIACNSHNAQKWDMV
jgi:hypothetical protein